MAENLAVRRKNRQISTKSRKKLTVKIFLLIATKMHKPLSFSMHVVRLSVKAEILQT